MKRLETNQIYKHGINVFIYFLYIYNISFVFLPSVLRTRVIFGFIGLFFFISQDKLGLPKSLGRIFLLCIISISFIILTTVINNYFDSRFIGNTIQNILYLFGAYYLVIQANINRLYALKLVILSIFLHNFLALLMFLNPSLLEIMTSIQSTGDKFEYALGNVVKFGTRFIGIGAGTFFSGGIISSIGVLLSTYVITTEKKSKLLWKIIYVFISITGIYIARVAFLGIFLSLIYFLINYIQKKNYTSLPKIIVYSTFFGIIVFSYILVNLDKLMTSNSFRHSFEIFINLFSSGDLKTDSTEGVKAMLIFPSNLKSLLIGDGQFYYDNGSFYMHTDIGYSRLVYYYGIFGILVYFSIHFYILFYNIKRFNNDKGLKLLLWSLTFLLLIGNFKGLLDVNWIIFIFYWLALYKIKIENENLPYHK
ncbi:hypothetical protein ASG22_17420 [Chryseobacterium sp. Leaf405]|uniref:hypothetical protein n=1 Tax=Chryseobacterium sp. Leaf405 TaxID=1736367 RepID=UPI0006F9C221|nr:hypothetical protein [Chryseobacterium sp. Leaf405]KQT33880.1 hypothetical protein ASG22_17420 [Chryseobacterium sp. Leaf405]